MGTPVEQHSKMIEVFVLTFRWVSVGSHPVPLGWDGFSPSALG